MNVALFGGTFDPVHRGHLAIARAAAARFKLGRVLFVPADIPPHKQKQPVTPYYHRYAMVSLALAGEKKFVPSLLEAPEIARAEGRDASYSIDTVRRLKKTLGRNDRLYFLIGIDAFKEIAKWRSPVELLSECEFIVASRPGFSLADVAGSLPKELQPADEVTKLFNKAAAHGALVLPEATIHLLDSVKETVSATKLREAAAAGRSLTAQVGASVAEYIRKEDLYKKDVQQHLQSAVAARTQAEQQRNQAQQEKEAKRKRARLQVVGGREHQERGEPNA